ncbi:MAG: VacJ family lipoprotein [Gammaproteobacteria bacterium]|nr:VacJ family lipoprotein [Gammaproteobacteria bacterium]
MKQNKQFIKSFWWSGLILLLLLIGGCASVPDANMGSAVDQDPWQDTNRKIYAFNKVVDNTILLPTTRAYAAIVPDVVEQGVTNIFNNLSEVKYFANHLLQGKPLQAGNDAARLLINSTVGVMGLFDVASHFGMYAQAEDFGQTLGYWGVESGPYVVLPLLGPSSVRDGISLTVDQQLDPLADYQPKDHRLGLQVLQVLDTRNQLQDLQHLVIGDEYTFVRDAYLARRAMQIRDGRPVTNMGTESDEFDEFD